MACLKRRIIPCVVEVCGAYWGDEGKGRVAAFEAKDAKLVLRTTGGNNAGHTVYCNGEKIPLHLVPGGIIYPHITAMICRGVVVDPHVLIEEIKLLRNYVTVNKDNLKISSMASIIMPYHRDIDVYQERVRGKNSIGTTKRGIGPTYEDQRKRVGLQFRDLFLERKELVEKVNKILDFHGVEIKDKTYEVKELVNTLMDYKNILEDYIVDEEAVLSPYLENGVKIVIEGAQAQHLDILGYDYPNCTSSECNPAGTISGAWIGPVYVDRTIGVMKAYCSRVGNGAFPTELENEEGDVIREFGHEYGTTTGRPRRCGWLDLVALAKTAGYTDLCLNHLDTIGLIGQKLGHIKICTGYMIDGKEYKSFPHNINQIADKIVPKYKVFEGGFEIPEGCDIYDKLPDQAKAYVEFIEEYTGIPVSYIGIGPNNEDTIVRTAE